MSRRPDIPIRRQVVYATVAIALVFVLLEAGLALVGIRPITAVEDPYVGFSDYFPLFVNGPDGRMETAANKLTLFNAQSFDRDKQAGTFRIFTLGGSTTYGRPFDDGTSFTGWLRAYLDALDGERSWEVINAGGISYASYRAARLMEELVDYEPDLFVIYSGNNEFLEKRTYGELIESLDDPGALVRGRSLLQRTRIWTAGRSLLGSDRDAAERRYQMTGEVEELLNTSAGLDHYFRDREFEEQVFRHYRFNLQRMIDLAREAGARVVLVTVPVNERDFPPFKSQHADGIDDRGLVEEASNKLESGDPESARRLAAQAVALDPLHADSHFMLARALTALGLHDLAAPAYARALAEDVCPLRAGVEIDRAIREVGEANGVPIVDYRGLLKARAEHGVLGDEFFFDHVHPRPEANGLLAEALVAWMGQAGIVESAVSDSVGQHVRETVLARVDAQAEARAYKNLAKVLIWAGKPQAAQAYLEQAGDTLDADWEAHYHAGLAHLAADRHERAVASLLAATDLNPRAAAAFDRLATAYAALTRWDEAVEAGRRATVEDPSLAIAWSNLSTHLDGAGHPQQALASAQEALRLDPDLADAHNNLGNILLDAGRAEEALQRYERAVALRPGFANARVNRGLALGELGRFREALQAMDAALAREPGLCPALLGKAKALLALGEVGAAIEPLERALELQPANEEAYVLLVGSLESLARPAPARQAIERGLSMLPESGRLHHLQGRMEAGAGALESATRAFSLALELAPGLIEARADLARVLLMLGRVEEAIPHLESAVRDAPDDTAVLVDLALVREHLGERERALGLFRRALELDPASTPARDGARRLAASVR